MYILSILKLKSLYVAKTNVRACCLVNSDAPNRGCCAKCIVQSALSTWRRRSTMSVSIPGTNSRQPLCICVFARSFLLFSCRLCSQLQFVLPFHRVYHNKRNVANWNDCFQLLKVCHHLLYSVQFTHIYAIGTRRYIIRAHAQFFQKTIGEQMVFRYSK